MRTTKLAFGLVGLLGLSLATAVLGRGAGHHLHDHRERTLPRQCRRLRILPYRPGWQAIRRRARCAYAFRHYLFHQHHSGSGNRHRQLVGTGFLQSDARRHPS